MSSSPHEGSAGGQEGELHGQEGEAKKGLYVAAIPHRGWGTTVNIFITAILCTMNSLRER